MNENMIASAKFEGDNSFRNNLPSELHVFVTYFADTKYLSSFF